MRCWDASIGAERFDAPKDGSSGFAGDGLVGDGFDEDLVRRFGSAFFHAEFPRFFDQRGEKRVLRREGVHGAAQVEGRKFVFGGDHEAPIRKRDE